MNTKRVFLQTWLRQLFFFSKIYVSILYPVINCGLSSENQICILYLREDAEKMADKYFKCLYAKFQ